MDLLYLKVPILEFWGDLLNIHELFVVSLFYQISLELDFKVQFYLEQGHIRKTNLLVYNY